MESRRLFATDRGTGLFPKDRHRQGLTVPDHKERPAEGKALTLSRLRRRVLHEVHVLARNAGQPHLREQILDYPVTWV